jgi:hypothetical protein
MHHSGLLNTVNSPFMSTEKPFCKRCMLDELMDNYDGVIEDYINSMNDAIKTEKQEYIRRLTLCSNCDQLINGVCRLCGCFVKARAAKKQMSCPSTPPRWQRTE